MFWQIILPLLYYLVTHHIFMILPLPKQVICKYCRGSVNLFFFFLFFVGFLVIPLFRQIEPNHLWNKLIFIITCEFVMALSAFCSPYCTGRCVLEKLNVHWGSQIKVLILNKNQQQLLSLWTLNRLAQYFSDYTIKSANI